MSPKRTYWLCQFLGWGIYCGLGIWQASLYYSLRPSMLAGWTLYFCYSIGLTELLRREMRRRRWFAMRPDKLVLRSVGAALLIGLVQTLSVVAIEIALDGRASFYSRPQNVLYL